MTELKQLAHNLRLADLRAAAKSGCDLSGCLLSAASAHDPDSKQQRAVIRYLVKGGVSVNETDKNGVTPLHRAVRFRSLAAVQLLLELGADVNATDRRSGSTPLHRAVTNTGAPATADKQAIAAKIAQVLLEQGANASAKNKSGRRPVDYAKTGAMQSLLHP
ncbi:MAG: ankyrin repeat domain-containing protein [Bythopirellula sp.]